MKISIQVFVWTCAFIYLGQILRVVWLDHLVGLCITFLEIDRLFPKWLYFDKLLYYFTFLPAVHKGFNYSISSAATLGIFNLFNFNHSNREWVVSHCAFNLYFPNVRWVKHIFMCLSALCISSLVDCLFKYLAHNIIWLKKTWFPHCVKKIFSLDIGF